MLEAKQLSKSYQGKEALKPTSFTVNKGDIFCLSINPLFMVVSVWLSSSAAFAQATFQPPETPLEIRSQKVSGYKVNGFI